jgi:hypothetical protein
MPDLGCLLRLVWPGGRTTIPELDQPLMVVVLEMIARAALSAMEAVNKLKEKGRAANMNLL